MKHFSLYDNNFSASVITVMHYHYLWLSLQRGNTVPLPVVITARQHSPITCAYPVVRGNTLLLSVHIITSARKHNDSVLFCFIPYVF